jgi:hypothetical protein
MVACGAPVLATPSGLLIHTQLDLARLGVTRLAAVWVVISERQQLAAVRDAGPHDCTLVRGHDCATSARAGEPEKPEEPLSAHCVVRCVAQSSFK